MDVVLWASSASNFVVEFEMEADVNKPSRAGEITDTDAFLHLQSQVADRAEIEDGKSPIQAFFFDISLGSRIVWKSNGLTRYNEA